MHRQKTNLYRHHKYELHQLDESATFKKTYIIEVN